MRSVPHDRTVARHRRWRSPSAVTALLASIAVTGAAIVTMQAASGAPRSSPGGRTGLIFEQTFDSGSFEGLDLQEGKRCSRVEGGLFRFSESPRRAGKYAMAHDISNCDERSEVEAPGTLAVGKTYWIGWSFFAPKGFFKPGPSGKDGTLIQQMGNVGAWKDKHAGNLLTGCDGPAGSTLGINPSGQSFNYNLRYFKNRDGQGRDVFACKHFSMPGGTDRWHDFVMQLTLSSTPGQGAMRLWKDGTAFVDEQVPLMRPGDERFAWKMGAYTGNPGNGERLVYTDELRVGDERASLADVSPGGPGGEAGSPAPAPTAGPSESASADPSPSASTTPSASDEPSTSPSGSTSPAPTTAGPRRNLIEEGTFDDSSTGLFTTETGKGCGSADAVRVTGEPARAGAGAARFTLAKCHERTELRADDNVPPLGAERWYGWSLYLPTDYESDADSGYDFVSQFHQIGTKSSPVRQIATGLKTSEGKWEFGLHHQKDPTAPPSQDNTAVSRQDLGPIEGDLGRWTDWVVHVRWTHQADGFFELYKNGKLVWSYRGATHFRFDHGRGPNFKMGIYKGDPDWPGTARSKVLYGDEYRMGSEKATYADVAPGDDSGAMSGSTDGET